MISLRTWRAKGELVCQDTGYSMEVRAALWCFLLAAIAGVVLRMAGAGLVGFETLDLSNLRRAHSHLMLFSWVTPALAALIASNATPDPKIRVFLRAMLVLGLLSFPSFLVSGYQPVQIGSARVPLSIIFSTLSMFAWYAFAIAWIRIRGEVQTTTNALAVRAWDGAIFLLVLGSLGAWARGALTGMGNKDMFLQHAAVEFFLTTYVDGFLMIGVLGLVLTTNGDRWKAASKCMLGMIIVLTPFEFLAFLPIDLVPKSLRPVGAIAALCIGLGGLYFAASVNDHLARAFLLVLGGGKLMLVHPESAAEVLGLGLRIPYLHVLLLGFVTITLVEHISLRWSTDINPSLVRPMVVLALVALLPTTGLWPSFVSRELGLVVTALASVLPVGAIYLGINARWFPLFQHTIPSSCPR